MGNKTSGYPPGKHKPVLLLLLFSLLTFHPLHGQETLPEIKVTVSSRNSTINQILGEITLQTGYHFTYNAAFVPDRKKIDFSVRELNLKETLDSLLADTRMDYRVVDRNIVIFRKNSHGPLAISQEVERSMVLGRVLDKRSGKALPYATVALLETKLGTITNQQGGFSFKIPLDLPNPMLVISFLGYRNLVVPIEYPVTNDLEIQLERETVPLQEVIIRYADPVKLLNESIRKIPRNYLDQHSTMTAFYRESVKRNDHCMVYTEAVLDVAKGPYSAFLSKDQVSIRKRRKISDVNETDTVLIKLRSGITTSLNLDVVKNRPDFIQEDFQDRYDFEYTDMMTLGDRLVYVIRFEQKPEIQELLFKGDIYLDHETLAIVATDFEFNPRIIHREPGLFLVSRSPRINIRPVYARYHVDYRSENNRYYMSHIRAEVEMKVRKRRRWIGSRYLISMEMAITDLIPGQRLRIEASDRVSRHIVLADEPFQFDPLFWGIYNTIEPEASLMESILKLEHNKLEISE